MEELRVRLEQIGGCGDGGCMIHVRPGMHTNGGCRCSTDPLKMRQTVHTYKMAVKEQKQEIAELKAEVAQFQAIVDILFNLTQHLALSPVYLKKIPQLCKE